MSTEQYVIQFFMYVLAIWLYNLIKHLYNEISALWTLHSVQLFWLGVRYVKFTSFYSNGNPEFGDIIELGFRIKK